MMESTPVDKFAEQNGTLILCDGHSPISFRRLFSAINEISPGSELGTWEGPVAAPPKGVDPGVQLLSLDGVTGMSVLQFNSPAPLSSIDLGPSPNFLWPEAEKEMSRNKAHIMVMAVTPVCSQKEAIARARALTLLTAAVMSLVPAIGMVWVASSQAVDPRMFKELTAHVRKREGLAVPLWVRVLMARAPAEERRQPTVVAATLGLFSFGLRELEYHPVALSERDIFHHALDIATYQLETGTEIRAGDPIRRLDDAGELKTKHLQNNSFTRRPTLLLFCEG